MEIIDELDRKPGLCPLEGRPAKILVVVEDYLLSPFTIRFNMMFSSYLSPRVQEWLLLVVENKIPHRFYQ